MMKKLIFTTVFLLILSGVSAYIGTVYPNYVESGENAVYVTLHNQGQSRLDDVQVSLYIYDFHTYVKSTNFDIRKRDATRKRFVLDVPDMEPGYYPVRIVLEGDGIREVRYTWLSLEQ